jgi:hypothetical protein
MHALVIRVTTSYPALTTSSRLHNMFTSAAFSFRSHASVAAPRGDPILGKVPATTPLYIAIVFAVEQLIFSSHS